MLFNCKINWTVGVSLFVFSCGEVAMMRFRNRCSWVFDPRAMLLGLALTLPRDLLPCTSPPFGLQESESTSIVISEFPEETTIVPGSLGSGRIWHLIRKRCTEGV